MVAKFLEGLLAEMVAYVCTSETSLEFLRKGFHDWI